MTTARLPDFLIIGKGKSGTTSLFNWLGTHPRVWLPEVKEPDFFARPNNWALGIDWYSAMFAAAPAGSMTGEASTSMTRAKHARAAAPRVREVVPHAPLVYVVRDPISRLRSHYAMNVRRGDERRLLGEALADPECRYIVDTLYYTCVEPYLELFPRDQLLVVRMEDVVGDGNQGWFDVLDHLGLERVDAPGTRSNHAAQAQVSTRLARWVREHGMTRPPEWTPKWIRDRARPLFLRSQDDDPRVISAKDPIPDDVVDRIYDDADRLAAALGRPPLWSRPNGPRTAP